MKYNLFTVKKGWSNGGTEVIKYRGNIRNIKSDGRSSHTSFNLEILGRLIKSKFSFDR